MRRPEEGGDEMVGALSCRAGQECPPEHADPIPPFAQRLGGANLFISLVVFISALVYH